MKAKSKYLALFIFTSILAGCSSYDVYFIDTKIKAKPKQILIGNFEKRNMDFDPFVEKNFKDSLRFELIKNHYSASITAPDKEQKSNNIFGPAISQLLSENNSDIYIQGIISVNSYGDALSNKTSTLVTVSFYDTNGVLIGETRYYTGKSLSNSKEIKNISMKIVQEFDSSIKKRTAK